MIDWKQLEKHLNDNGCLDKGLKKLLNHLTQRYAFKTFVNFSIKERADHIKEIVEHNMASVDNDTFATKIDNAIQQIDLASQSENANPMQQNGKGSIRSVRGDSESKKADTSNVNQMHNLTRLMNKSQLALELKNNRAKIALLGIKSIREMRKKIHSKDQLLELGIDEKAAKVFYSFTQLARLFPAEIAIALQQSGADELSTLIKWNEIQFRTSLRNAGIKTDVLEIEVSRFKRMQKLADTGVSVDKLLGLEVDLGSKTEVSTGDKRLLAEAGIDTLEDWAALGERLKVSRATKKLLDAQARLKQLSMELEATDILIENEIFSALDLLSLDKEDKEKLKQRFSSKIDIQGLMHRAIGQFNDAIIGVQNGLIDGLRPTPEDDDPLHCEPCLESQSAFSCFAYFLYLVNKTQRSLQTIDDILHQDLASLAPITSEEEQAQVSICLNVLIRAFPGRLSGQDTMLARRLVIRQSLSLLPVPLSDFAKKAARFPDTGSPEDITNRLQLTFSADNYALQPNFSDKEIKAMSSLLDLYLIGFSMTFLSITIEQFAEIVTDNEPTIDLQSLISRLKSTQQLIYGGADNVSFLSDESKSIWQYIKLHISARGSQKIIDPLNDAELEASVLLRDLLKNRIGKTDATLYQELFIETNLGSCENISRCKQAINSLQALLLALKNQAASTEARSSFDFLSYPQWHSEQVAQYYPELSALYRGDALVGDNGSIDRGSFLKNHIEQKAAIEEQLKKALENIRRARISQSLDENNEFLPPDNMTDTRFEQLPVFANKPFMKPFENGTVFIKQFLAIDKLVVDAHDQIDQDEAWLAIATLEQAMSDLDSLYYQASEQDSILRETSSNIYHSLLNKSPQERYSSVENHWHELETGYKTIFNPSIPPIEIVGLTNNRFSNTNVLDESPWRTPNSSTLYQLRGDIPNITLNKSTYDGPDQLIPRWVYYADNDLSTNYSYKITFKLTADSREPFDEGQYIGLGIRLREEGVDDKLSGYQVIIRSRRVSTMFDQGAVSTGSDVVDGILNTAAAVGSFFGSFLGDGDGDSASALRYFLVVQKINANGSAPEDVTEEKVAHVSLNNPETLYTLSVQVNGSRLNASLSNDDENQIIGVTTANFNGLNIGSGSFGIVCAHGVQAIFHTLDVGLQNWEQPLPFQSLRRLEGFPVIRTENLHQHSEFGDSCSLNLPQELIFEISDYTFARRGISTDPLEEDPYGRWLVFAPENKAVDIESLDKLLENCMEGMYYLRYLTIPLALSRSYLEAGDFSRSSQMMRIVYDINDNTNIATEIYPFFAMNNSDRSLPGLDARLMRLRIGEIYLRWATWLFQQNGSKERKQARELLNQTILIHGGHQLCNCNRKVKDVIETIYTQERALIAYPIAEPADFDFKALITLLSDPVMDDSLVAGIANELDFTDASENSIKKRLAEIKIELTSRLTQLKKDFADNHNAKSIFSKSKEAIQQSEVQLLSRKSIPAFDSLFHSRSAERVSTSPRRNYNNASIFSNNLTNSRMNMGFHLKGRGDYIVNVDWISFTLCLPENPLMQIQRQQACLMLDDLIHCRNILGFEDGLVPPLRYEALDRIATGFSSLALSAERDLLQFRRDTETTHMSEMEAIQSLAISIANIAIEANRVTEAEGDALLAALQKTQTIETANHLDELIASGLSDAEKSAMLALQAAIFLSGVAGVANTFGSFAGSIANPNPASIISGLFGTVGTAASSAAGVFQLKSQEYSMQASFERREQEWRQQLSISRLGLQISERSLQQAQIRRTITQQQYQLAQLRNQFAQDGLTFLANRFLNSAMFLWMMQTVRREYKQRLNYANGAAFMAQEALSFELQQELDYIRFDYFDPSRDGLLGATQLNTDLATLRNIKLSATERKLQIRKTISLRSELPIEFQQFKSGTGALHFVTLMDWFDRDRPGEYLRTIKSVRVTVLALVPPIAGIHATLNNNGISTLVGRPPEFSSKTVRRDPELIALSAGFNDTGVFVLDYRGDLLLPFEGSGVETSWSFSMPKATNHFNFDTIADVLLTIEYTALKDTNYQQVVIEHLKAQGFKADQFYSIRHQYPDEWYHLHNPVDDNTAPSIKVTVTKDHFPSNLSSHVVKHLSLYLDWHNDLVEQDVNITLLFKTIEDIVISSPAVLTNNGIIRTRNNEAPLWKQKFIDVANSPFGEWTIEFEKTPGISQLFSENKLNDILFGFSFQAEQGGWN